MPRGFLVKRNRRAPVGYRSRSIPERPEAAEARAQKVDSGVLPHTAVGNSSAEFREAWSPHVESALEAEADRRAQLPDYEEDAPSPAVAELPELQYLGSTTTPTITASVDRLLCSSSSGGGAPTNKREPALAHLFPPLTLMTPEHHAAGKRCFLHAEQHGKQQSRPTLPPGAPKKHKVTRKLLFEDEVTTSPVLGLRIKKEGPDGRRQKAGAPTGTQPLGEFICQLCKEEYPDPFSLAQHKCSRIVRVEYRCPECDKVFSCPANLASHRRWHKPRPAVGPSGETSRNQPLKEARALIQHERPLVGTEGKENELLRATQHRGAREHESPLVLLRARSSPDTLPPPPPPHYDSPSARYRSSSDSCAELQLQVRAADSPPPGLLLRNPHERADLPPPPFVQSLPEEELYECRYCGKKFRRQAYLKKHLLTHDMTSYSPELSTGQSQQQVFLCHLCGARFPTAEIRDKHRLWHAMRDELLAAESLAAARRTDVFQARADDHLDGERQQVFTCKFCPSTFFSSPGLTRHINKTHPAENRQVMRLQMTVRP